MQIISGHYIDEHATAVPGELSLAVKGGQLVDGDTAEPVSAVEYHIDQEFTGILIEHPRGDWRFIASTNDFEHYRLPYTPLV